MIISQKADSLKDKNSIELSHININPSSIFPSTSQSGTDRKKSSITRKEECNPIIMDLF